MPGNPDGGVGRPVGRGRRAAARRRPGRGAPVRRGGVVAAVAQPCGGVGRQGPQASSGSGSGAAARLTARAPPTPARPGRRRGPRGSGGARRRSRSGGPGAGGKRLSARRGSSSRASAAAPSATRPGLGAGPVRGQGLLVVVGARDGPAGQVVQLDAAARAAQGPAGGERVEGQRRRPARVVGVGHPPAGLVVDDHHVAVALVETVGAALGHHRPDRRAEPALEADGLPHRAPGRRRRRGARRSRRPRCGRARGGSAAWASSRNPSDDHWRSTSAAARAGLRRAGGAPYTACRALCTTAPSVLAARGRRAGAAGRSR